jgi:hypothetical protein
MPFERLEVLTTLSALGGYTVHVDPDGGPVMLLRLFHDEMSG